MTGIMVITGAGRGIGAATARLAAQRGYKVAINYVRQRAAADALADELRAASADAITVQADVSREEEVASLFEQVDAALGTLTVLINNAGIVAPSMRLEQMEQARLERMFAVNVIGSMLCAKQAVRRMSTLHGGAGGSIVNVSSGASKHGSAGHYVDYAASKGAIDTFTIGLARELASEGVRVNAVRPGIIRTEIHAASGDPERAAKMGASLPMKRAGEADEVARAMLWLASSDASYCTGSIVDVSGGR